MQGLAWVRLVPNGQGLESDRCYPPLVEQGERIMPNQVEG